MGALGIYLAGALLLVAAGVAKAARPGDTSAALAASFSWWPRRVGPRLVRGGAVAEAGLGVAALALPARPLLLAVAASYLAFAVFVGIARVRGGPLATCGCFGTPDTPPTVGHLLVNLLLGAGAVSVAIAGPHGTLAGVLAHQYDHGAVLVAVSLVLAGFVYLVLVPLARLDALRAHRPSGAG